MSPNARPEASVFVIFGLAGDLTWRKLVPALYNPFLEDHLPKQFAIPGVGHNHQSHCTRWPQPDHAHLFVLPGRRGHLPGGG